MERCVAVAYKSASARVIRATRDRVYFLPLGLPAGLLPFAAAGLLPFAAGAALPPAAAGAPPANALP